MLARSSFSAEHVEQRLRASPRRPRAAGPVVVGVIVVVEHDRPGAQRRREPQVEHRVVGVAVVGAAQHRAREALAQRLAVAQPQHATSPGPRRRSPTGRPKSPARAALRRTRPGDPGIPCGASGCGGRVRRTAISSASTRPAGALIWSDWCLSTTPRVAAISSSSMVSSPSASTVRPQSMVSATDGSFLSCMPRSTPMMRTSSSARCSGSSGTRDSRMRRSRSGSGKSMCRNRHRRLSASDSSRVALEVSSTNGVRSAVIVPSSGTVTAKSDSTSSSRPSISMSALSVSSISRTVGSVRRIAVSSGRVSRNSSLNTSVFVWSQSPCPAWIRRICLAWFHS